MNTINVILEKTNTGYSAYSTEITGAGTVGDTIEEVKNNYAEIIELTIDYFNEIGDVEKAQQLQTANIKYHIDLNAFFEYYSLFNKSELAKYLGINPSHLRRLSMPNMELSNEKAEQIQMGLQRLSKEIQTFSFS
ncbi:type II toxin-antitoxin system HicB family antitoxin [Capnocytophaga sp. ARDL2]|uniref:type II toxin-antitoxin system HicB family antitoxin n=1 Tax=Capnocytophaga sp. ARDL2 TaxID=3238809 RepID=UPI003558A7FA